MLHVADCKVLTVDLYVAVIESEFGTVEEVTLIELVQSLYNLQLIQLNKSKNAQLLLLILILFLSGAYNATRTNSTN